MKKQWPIDSMLIRDVRVCIVADEIDKLKPTGMLFGKHKSLFKYISKELFRSNGVKLRGKGNLREWETRGVLLLDPSTLSSKDLLITLARLRNVKQHVTFILIGKSASRYAPLIDTKEEENTLHVFRYPIGAGLGPSIIGSGVFAELRHMDWTN